MAVRRIVMTPLVASLVLAAPALARLPRPKTTLIVPGRSLAGVKLDMTQAQALGQWGATSCSSGVCRWIGPGNPSQAERATVSLWRGKVVGIAITAGWTGANVKFKPGVLSRWRTAKGIQLGSKKSAVRRAYPSAKANTGEAVQGYDLFAGARPNLSFTRFSAFGHGATPTLIRGIEVNWDVCHFMRDTCG